MPQVEIDYSGFAFLWNDPYFLILFFALLFFFLLFFLLRYFFHAWISIKSGFDKAIFLILLPKEAADKGQEKKEITTQIIQEGIAAAENLFNTLAGIKAQGGFFSWFLGRQDVFSLEIVAHQGLISFYVVVPKKNRQYFEEQIHAHFSSAFIEEVPDYNIFQPQGIILSSLLTFARDNFFPIKTYKKIETDSLNSLTNVLSRLGKDDGAAIQLVLRSAPKTWRRKGVKVASAMQQGKSLGEAMASIGWWSHFLKAIKPPKLNKKDLPKETPETYRLSPLEEEMVKGLEEKANKAAIEANIRIIVSGKNKESAEIYLNNIVNSFSQFNIYEYGNRFVKNTPRSVKRITRDFIFRSFHERKKVILNTEELSSLYHFPFPWIETPNIKWLSAKKAPPPVNLPQEGLILGKSIYRGEEIMVRIKRSDRRRHTYIIGKSGSGKSWLMANMIRQDIENGEGVGVIDPHGGLIDDVIGAIPKDRIDDVVYFDPSDMERPVGLNMLDTKGREEIKDFAVQEMIAIFYKLFPPEMIGPMFEHHMRNVMLTLMSDAQNPGTLVEIPRMFNDPEFQKKWVRKLKDPIVRNYWEQEVAKTTDFHKSEMLGYLISKVGRFVENEMMRNIIGQTHSGFDFREIMDKKKILLVNLAKGKTGEVNSSLLGLIIVSKLQMAAMSRAELSEEARHDFYLYVDEFQNFITDSIATILSEARKYRLCLVLAHQYIGQLVDPKKNDTSVRDAIFGNVGTLLAYRIGVDDTETIAKEFAPVFNEYDCLNVEMFTANIKLLIDNQASKPFNIKTNPLAPGNLQLAEKIKQLARLKYGRDRSIVEAEIMERSQLDKAKASTEFSEKTL